MIRKYHNHKLQTTLWHREEEPLNFGKGLTCSGLKLKSSYQKIKFPISQTQPNLCKRPLSRRSKIGFQDQLSLTAGQKYCRMGSTLICYYLSLRSFFCLFLVAVLHRFYCNSLHISAHIMIYYLGFDARKPDIVV